MMLSERHVTSRDMHHYFRMLHILAHYIVIKITPPTFVFTGETNSGLMGESLEFV